jgi:glycosyltransferase involved in cell wall biosynthesis
MIKTAHILRKYQPSEWAGTETAVLRLLEGLRPFDVASKVFCPQIPLPTAGPFEHAGFDVRRVNAFLPLWGFSEENRTKLIANGGNLLSFELFRALWQEPDLSLIHTHALGLFGGIALTIARLRRIPIVVSVHGGYFDIAEAAKIDLKEALTGTFNWGKPFSLFFGARNLLKNADLVLTANHHEAELLRKHYPKQKIDVAFHAINTEDYQNDKRHLALNAYPDIAEKDLLVYVGRIDPVKNQLWLIDQVPHLIKKLPRLKLLLIGPFIDAAYSTKLKQRIEQLGLQEIVRMTGEISNDDPCFIGLMQQAKIFILPSLAETFGLVILEAWACGIPVVANRTTGASYLIDKGKYGWLFNIEDPATFHRAIDDIIDNPRRRFEIIAKAKEHVLDFNPESLGNQMHNIYKSLMKNES